MIVTDKYVLFWGEEDIFSNFYPCNFSYQDGNMIYTFSNSEQLFMYKKAIQFKAFEIADKILSTPKPYGCKKLGRLIPNYEEKVWEVERYKVMVEVLTVKFNSNLLFKQCLQLTIGKTIVEASPYDKIWGVGLEDTHTDILNEDKWKGLNLLGKALMEVRDNMFKH